MRWEDKAEFHCNKGDFRNVFWIWLAQNREKLRTRELQVLEAVGNRMIVNCAMIFNNKVTYYELNDSDSTSGRRRVIFPFAATRRPSLGPTKFSDRKALSPILEQPEHETTHLFWCRPTLKHA